jgi:hypothetical protein
MCFFGDMAGGRERVFGVQLTKKKRKSDWDNKIKISDPTEQK